MDMVNDEFVGRFIAFKANGDDYAGPSNVLLEVTEVKGGDVEIALTAPIPGSPRIYITFPLTEVVRRSMREPSHDHRR